MTLYSLLDAKLGEAFGTTVDQQFAKEQTIYGEVYQLEKLYNCEPLHFSEQPMSKTKIEKTYLEANVIYFARKILTIIRHPPLVFEGGILVSGRVCFWASLTRVFLLDT